MNQCHITITHSSSNIIYEKAPSSLILNPFPLPASTICETRTQGDHLPLPHSPSISSTPVIETGPPPSCVASNTIVCHDSSLKFAATTIPPLPLGWTVHICHCQSVSLSLHFSGHIWLPHISTPPLIHTSHIHLTSLAGLVCNFVPWLTLKCSQTSRPALPSSSH